ncbi:MAG TPA: hypothetical protein V6C78_21255 [Crinalium sp.]
MSSLMRSRVPIQDMIQRANPSPFYVLIARNRYSSCHVLVPEMEKPLAAICLADHYYSFFTTVTDSRRALGIAVKLSYLGDRAVITKIPKGYAIWVWETEMQLFGQSGRAGLNVVRSPKVAPCKVLVSREQYRALEIQVPDLDQPLSSIQFEGNYYSIFRVETDATKILELVAKITQRGDEMVITKADKGGFALCVLEPEGYLPQMSIKGSYLN